MDVIYMLYSFQTTKARKITQICRFIRLIVHYSCLSSDIFSSSSNTQEIKQEIEDIYSLIIILI